MKIVFVLIQFSVTLLVFYPVYNHHEEASAAECN